MKVNVLAGRQFLRMEFVLISNNLVTFLVSFNAVSVVVANNLPSPILDFHIHGAWP